MMPDSPPIDWDTWSPTERAVLCFVRDDQRLLLIHKKTGLGAAKINAPGGRVEPGETPVRAAIRETQEEVGLTPLDPRDVGTLSFQFTDGYGLFCTVFFCSRWTGSPVETDEADPFWCQVARIPYDRMWADDRLWLPLALAGRRFAGYFVFDGERMLSHDLRTG